MSRAASDSFILELPLATTVVDDCALGVRLNAARQIFNAVLGECLRILGLMRESRDWGRARAIPKAGSGWNCSSPSLRASTSNPRWPTVSPSPARTVAGLAIICRRTRRRRWRCAPFRGSAAWLGQRGRPRFKRLGEIQSIEGKTNKTGIRFTGDGVEWSGLRLAILLAPHDPGRPLWPSRLPNRRCDGRRQAKTNLQAGPGSRCPTVARPSEWVVRRRKDKMSSRLRTAYRWTVSIREGRREQAKSGENLPTSFQNPTD